MDLEKLGIKVLEGMKNIEIIVSNPGELDSSSGERIEYGFFRRYIHIELDQWRVSHHTTANLPHCPELNLFMECSAACRFYHANGDGTHCDAEPTIISTKSLLEVIRLQDPEHVLEERDGYAKIDSTQSVQCGNGKGHFAPSLCY